ncbi:hypothetical protein ACEUB7_06145 [Aeromonas veronii]
MEAQTLQQQVPVYHVCQQCNGAGCQACSDLLILEGDVELDPYECPYCGWIGGHVDGCVFVDPDLDSSPINGVIGTTPDYPLSNQMTVRSLTPGLKYDIRFDDRNMYQRREDELRLAGEWEV